MSGCSASALLPQIAVAMRSFAKLAAVEAEAAAPPGAAGCRRLGPVRPRDAVGNGGARGLRHAVAVAVQHFGSGAGLGDTPPVAFPLPRSAIGHANSPAARLEVSEEFRCWGVV